MVCLGNIITTWAVLREPFTSIIVFLLAANIPRKCISLYTTWFFILAIFLFDGFYYVHGGLLPVNTVDSTTAPLLRLLSFQVGFKWLLSSVSYVLGLMVSHIIQRSQIFPSMNKIGLLNIMFHIIHLAILFITPVLFQLTAYWAPPLFVTGWWWSLVWGAVLIGCAALTTTYFLIMYWFFGFENELREAETKKKRIVIVKRRKQWIYGMVTNVIFNYGFILLSIGVYHVPMYGINEDILCLPWFWNFIAISIATLIIGGVSSVVIINKWIHFNKKYGDMDERYEEFRKNRRKLMGTLTIEKDEDLIKYFTKKFNKIEKHYISKNGAWVVFRFINYLFKSPKTLGVEGEEALEEMKMPLIEEEEED